MNKYINSDSTLKEGQAIAFDFDGVIHKYSNGWQDGNIYDTYNKNIIDLILVLNTLKIPVFILSTRDPEQIKEWWDNQEFSLKSKIIEDETVFWNDLEFIGITKTKLAAQIYVDDRAYCYTGQSIDQILDDFTQNKKNKREEK